MKPVPINNNVILGIDPGTVVMGYAVIRVENGTVNILAMGVLKPGGIKDIYERLEMIYAHVNELITLFKPDTFAIEAPFFGKNVQSMLKLGRAQGVAIAAAMQHKITVTEYSPKKVKQSITGNGNAAKEQVWKMLQRQLVIEEKPRFFDASDALAVAMCHHYQTNFFISKAERSFKGWEDFLAKNPGRTVK